MPVTVCYHSYVLLVYMLSSKAMILNEEKKRKALLVIMAHLKKKYTKLCCLKSGNERLFIFLSISTLFAVSLLILSCSACMFGYLLFRNLFTFCIPFWHYSTQKPQIDVLLPGILCFVFRMYLLLPKSRPMSPLEKKAPELKENLIKSTLGEEENMGLRQTERGWKRVEIKKS